MAKQETISDEQIVSALMSTGSQRAAAKYLGISERTIYNRLSDGKFKALYNNAKNEVLRTAVNCLNEKLKEAIDTTAEIMSDQKAAPQTRLTAAKTIMDQAAHFADILSKQEGHVYMQIEENNDPFSWKA